MANTSFRNVKIDKLIKDMGVFDEVLDKILTDEEYRDYTDYIGVPFNIDSYTWGNRKDGKKKVVIYGIEQKEDGTGSPIHMDIGAWAIIKQLEQMEGTGLSPIGHLVKIATFQDAKKQTNYYLTDA